MMSKIHFLNVNQGDCIILEHNSGRLIVFDTSAEKIKRKQRGLPSDLLKSYITSTQGNYRMCHHPANPLDYFKRM